MANTFALSTVVIKMATMHLWNHLVAAKCVHRQVAKEFTGNYRTGGTVTIKKPLEFRAHSGATITTVDSLYQRSFTMAATTRYNTNFFLTSAQLTYEMLVGEVSEEIIKPAMAALANQIDKDVLLAYKKIPNQVGTPGTTPSNTLVLRQARERLTYLGVPEEDCYCILDPQAVTGIQENVKTLLHQPMVQTAVQSTPQKGKLAFPIAGFECYESANAPTHTTGSQAGVAGATKNGASSDEDTTLALTGLGATNTIAEGDIFTLGVAGANPVYAVRPMDGTTLPFLRQFVAGGSPSSGVTGLAAGGALSAQIAIPGTAPYNIRSGTAAQEKLPYQNVASLPANTAALTIAGAASTGYPISLAFHRNAIALATVPIHMPSTAPFKAQQEFEGISIRVVADFDVKNDLEIYRFDILYGVEVLEPQAACRIIG